MTSRTAAETRIVTKPVRYVCAECGSSEVLADAWSQWDVTSQTWVLTSVLDANYCIACDGECDVEAEDLE